MIKKGRHTIGNDLTVVTWLNGFQENIFKL